MALFFIDIQVFFYENAKNEYCQELKGGEVREKKAILSLFSA
jgi:hypothetical protein